MKKLFKYIIVMIRLARELRRFMPTDEIYKAKYIVANGVQSDQGHYGETTIRYTFELLSESAFDRKYKIHFS